MSPVQIRHIYYDEASRQALDPSSRPLDNTASPRPDWREQWPIRQHRLAQPLPDEDGLYGSFSWRFDAKTALSGAEAIAFAAVSDRDVVRFSPYVEQASFFLNVFEHGQANHPGPLPAMQSFVDAPGLSIDLARCVADHLRTVFSDFFAAKPASGASRCGWVSGCSQPARQRTTLWAG